MIAMISCIVSIRASFKRCRRIAWGVTRMRIAISGMFWSQPTVGSGQYLHGMLGELARVAPQHEYVLLLPGYLNDRRPTTDDRRPEAASVVGRQSSVVIRTPFDGRSKNFAKLWFEQIGVPLAAARLRADL